MGKEEDTIERVLMNSVTDSHPVYSTNDGWTNDGEPLQYDNPNRAWYNALWQPQKILIQRMVKTERGVEYAKWISVSGPSRIGWSEETV